jgi:putative transposase
MALPGTCYHRNEEKVPNRSPDQPAKIVVATGHPNCRSTAAPACGEGAGARLPGKSGGVLREGPQVKYALMLKFMGRFPLALMARVLQVSRSGFYAWHQRRESGPRARARAMLDAKVANAFAVAKGRSGAPRVTSDLVEAGYRGDRKTVAKSLRRQGLRARAARRFKATTDSNHTLPVAPNLLAQDFTAEAPDSKWVGDITYLWTDEGWLYLAVVIDLFSRKVVGWAMSERMKVGLVCDVLPMALWRRRNPREVIVHTDRGSQYCSRRYQALLAHHSLRCSMSGKGNCFDNAVAESFFHMLKVELIHGERFTNRDTMRQAVFEYIEVDYNRTRRHSTLGYVSPEVFEAARAA